MNVREKTIAGLELCGMTEENAIILFSNLVMAIKEEIIPKDMDYKEFFGLEDKQSELIQGYTAEQWQELKEGKYLCEFSNCSDFRNSYCGTIRVFRETSGSNPFLLNEYGNYFKYCRPARLRGAMSPIFVEPVDKDSFCHFFTAKDKGDTFWLGGVRWTDRHSQSVICDATKYIEV